MCTVAYGIHYRSMCSVCVTCHYITGLIVFGICKVIISVSTVDIRACHVKKIDRRGCHVKKLDRVAKIGGWRSVRALKLDKAMGT